MKKNNRIAIIICLSGLLFSCSYVELSGTMTKATGEVMTDFSENNDGFVGKMASFGGKINTAVGGTVENIAREGRSGQLEGSKSSQFVEGNKRVIRSAVDSVSSE
ncbi:hypothetical protein [Thiocapsa rosea]|uniref:Small secreted protein n=1 Tax=Thiocapsa rosea TaxID=69360 RepID=A0A495V584_9GAMM|nr:hypothetical protein [Thiocapsa rosea]RKT44454.1 hypothetical protein BDD21_1836 [Thiocapsa rosea]